MSEQLKSAEITRERSKYDLNKLKYAKESIQKSKSIYGVSRCFDIAESTLRNQIIWNTNPDIQEADRKPHTPPKI